ncbi:MAG: hypothetical protein IJ462_04140 [Clostridia bacterium]|nr:hypothetical protein [Clostridia bacterium]
MKKSAFYTIPIFSLLYYVLLLILYSGSLYIVVDNHIQEIPTDWFVLSFNVLHIVLSFLLIAFIKNKKVCHLILAAASLGVEIFGAVRFIPYINTFMENQNYSLPMYAAIFVVCFGFLTIAHTVTALKGKKKDIILNEEA